MRVLRKCQPEFLITSFVERRLGRGNNIRATGSVRLGYQQRQERWVKMVPRIRVCPADGECISVFHLSEINEYICERIKILT